MNSNQAQAYLSSGGESCPYCGNHLTDSKWIIKWKKRSRKCLRGEKCGKTWTDHYTLTGVDEFKKGGE